ncbi:MAG: DUF4340 domain-containing protein [Acidobacteriota bacterium]
MKWGRMLTAGVLLAGLAVALWWSNRQEKAKEGKPAADAPPKILALNADTIQQIEIRHRGEDPVTLQLKAGKWEMTSPKPLAADSSAVSAITSAASSIDAERVVDPNVTDLKPYGLAPALIQVDLGTKNGKTSKLLIGENTPSGSAVYAKLDGDPRLFTMASYTKSAFDKEAKDLRDKHLLPFTQDKVLSIEISAQKQTYAFAKKDNDWQIVKPKLMRADSIQTDDLAQALKNAEMDLSSVQDDKKNAAAFNSAPVLAIAKVTDQDGTKTLEIRKAKDEYYVKSSAVAGIYKVSKMLGDALDKPVDNYRNKKLFDFGFSDPTHIEATDGGKTSIFDKSGETWASGGKKMDSTSVQAFVDRLRDLSASKFVDSGFTTPVTTVTVVSNQGKSREKVEIAAAASGGSFLARRGGDASFYELEAGVVNQLRQAVGDVREAQPDKKK